MNPVTHICPTRIRSYVILVALLAVGSSAQAQIVAPNTTMSAPYVSTLQDQLVNGLRATRVEQQAFLKNIVQLHDQKTLDSRLINAVYRWSVRRQPQYPFPYFERAIRIESMKRGVYLPPIALVNNSGTLQLPENLPPR